jgi:hypothetical protein
MQSAYIQETAKEGGIYLASILRRGARHIDISTNVFIFKVR